MAFSRVVPSSSTLHLVYSVLRDVSVAMRAVYGDNCGLWEHKVISANVCERPVVLLLHLSRRSSSFLRSVHNDHKYRPRISWESEACGKVRLPLPWVQQTWRERVAREQGGDIS